MKLLVKKKKKNVILQSLLKMWGAWFCCSIRNTLSEWAQKKNIWVKVLLFLAVNVPKYHNNRWWGSSACLDVGKGKRRQDYGSRDLVRFHKCKMNLV